MPFLGRAQLLSGLLLVGSMTAGSSLLGAETRPAQRAEARHTSGTWTRELGGFGKRLIDTRAVTATFFGDLVLVTSPIAWTGTRECDEFAGSIIALDRRSGLIRWQEHFAKPAKCWDPT